MQVTIEPFGAHHLSATYLWIQEPSLRRDLVFTATVTPDSHRAWHEKTKLDSSQVLWAIYADGEHVGNVGLKNATEHRAEVWIYVGQEAVRGQGVGRRALELLRGQINPSIQELYARVAQWNGASLAMFRRAGFVEQGVQEDGLVLLTQKLGAYYFIVGGGTLQVEFIRKVQDRGFRAVVFDYNAYCPGAAVADLFFAVSIDDTQAVLAEALRLKPVAVQTVATELGNITACAVGSALGLYNNTHQTALDTTDKSRMKRVCQQFNLPTAQAVAYTSFADAQSTALPCVVKASDRSASRGVAFARTEQEFKAAFADAVQESNNKIVLVEEFLAGDQYSVETISVDGQHQIVGVTAEHTTGTPHFVEQFHVMPAPLDAAASKSLQGLVVRILDAFGVRYGAGHIELKYHQGRWSMIELASRMGGWRDDLAYLSQGIDYLGLIVDASLDRCTPVVAKWNKTAVCRMLLNGHEIERYERAKERFGDRICRAHVDLSNLATQAITLMHSAGWYYFVGENQEQANEFLSFCDE